MNFLSSKSKPIIFIFGLLSALLVILTIVFMTQYSHIHVAYSINEAGELIIREDSSITVGSYQLTNTYLASYLKNTSKVSPVTENFETAKTIIYNFQMNMNAFNNFILASFVVCICMFAILLIFSNQSRRVYYKSNLIVGIAAPAVAIIMCIVGVIWCITLISDFNTHADLYKITAVMENYSISAREKRPTSLSFEEFIAKYASGVDTLTMVLTIVLFVIILVAALCVIAHTVLKYKATTERRIEIINRAKAGVQ